MSRLRRLSIRARLSIAFSIALMLVLVVAAVFVYARVDAALTESADESLQARLEALRGLVVGTPIKVQTVDGVAEYDLVGIVGFGDADNIAGNDCRRGQSVHDCLRSVRPLHHGNAALCRLGSERTHRPN